MEIKHQPICANPDKVCEYYSKKDGVPIRYVCTTDVHNSDDPIDIFYRDTPHPQFGNRYFGIVFRGDTSYIMNVDIIDETVICCVEDDDGNLQYSQSHHDYKSFENGNMIDGGRIYTRRSGVGTYYVIEKGEMKLCSNI